MKYAKILIYAVSLCILFTFIGTMNALSPEQKDLKKAIQKGDFGFFEKVTKQNLITGNQNEGKSFIQKSETKSIPALIGAFSNPDIEVRKILYREMLFTEMKNKGEDPRKKMESDPESAPVLELFRKKLFASEEKDPEAFVLREELIRLYNYDLITAIRKKNDLAVAYMSPETLDSEISKNEDKIMKKWIKRSLKIFIKALGNERSSKETKLKLIEIIQLSKYGGPAKLIPKAPSLAKRADELFSIAEAEKDTKLIKKITDLGALYYNLALENK